MTIGICKICGAKCVFWRCDKHYVCDDCGTRENIVHRIEGVFCDSCFKKRIAKRIDEFDGDTEYTDNITCPYCGWVNNDSWEVSPNESEFEYDCGDCENTFKVERIVTIEYSTRK